MKKLASLLTDLCPPMISGNLIGGGGGGRAPLATPMI